MKIKIPIIHLKGNIYQVASQKLVFQIERNQLMIKFGGGIRSFHDLILKHEKQMQRVLTIFCLQSGESIDQVMNYIMKDRQLHGVKNQFRIQAKLDKKLIAEG